jgi:DHA1 family tetracycline resistance protein-like MFS transporter
LRKSPLLPIFLIVLVDILGYTIILPLLPFYAENLGASPLVVGTLVSAFAVCQFVAGPLLGRISDRVGRRPVLIVSQVGTLIGFLILANAHVLWLVFLSRIIDGLTAGNLSLAQAYISDVTRPSERSKSFAVIGIAFGIGFLIGPAISALLAADGNLSRPIYAGAALSFLSILCTYFLLPANPTIPDPEPGEAPLPPAGKRLPIFALGEYAKYFKQEGVRLRLWQFFLFAFSFSGFVSGFALYAERRFGFNVKQVGYLFAYSGFLGIILQGGLMGRLVKRFGDKALVYSAFIAATIGYGAVGFIYDWKILLVFTIFSSYGAGILRPSITSLVTQAGGRQEQGTLLGLTQSITSVCQITAPILAGFLIAHGWLAAWALVIAGTTAAGALSSFAERKATPAA